jgi:hypothetical protein
MSSLPGSRDKFKTSLLLQPFPSISAYVCCRVLGSTSNHCRIMVSFFSWNHSESTGGPLNVHEEVHSRHHKQMPAKFCLATVDSTVWSSWSLGSVELVSANDAIGYRGKQKSSTTRNPVFF